jgi:hypothetical protein
MWQATEPANRAALNARCGSYDPQTHRDNTDAGDEADAARSHAAMMRASQPARQAPPSPNMTIRQIESTIEHMEATEAREAKPHTKRSIERRQRIAAYRAELDARRTLKHALADDKPEDPEYTREPEEQEDADAHLPTARIADDYFPPPPTLAACTLPHKVTKEERDEQLRRDMRLLLDEYTLCAVLDAAWDVSKEMHA